MNSHLEGMIETSLDSLKKIVDVNTVVGEPITTESGTTVIPISKVSLGYVSGGTDFATKKSTEKSFAGGGGSGVTILPLGFLVIKESGNVEFLAAELKSQSGPVGSIVDLIEKSPDIVEKFKKLFSKPTPKEESPEEA
ncbi:MAG: sporulation protein YtfJ [Clostridia bacterium]|nr:sporulation protein YtfJ [Clostridia bacterium]